MVQQELLWLVELRVLVVAAVNMEVMEEVRVIMIIMVVNRLVMIQFTGTIFIKVYFILAQ